MLTFVTSPLTHFTEASRKSMIDGAGLLAIAPHLSVIGGLTVVFLGLSAALFKWEYFLRLTGTCACVAVPFLL
jgi:hypothetical protein